MIGRICKYESIERWKIESDGYFFFFFFVSSLQFALQFPRYNSCHDYFFFDISTLRSWPGTITGEHISIKRKKKAKLIASNRYRSPRNLVKLHNRSIIIRELSVASERNRRSQNDIFEIFFRNGLFIFSVSIKVRLSLNWLTS